MLDLPSEIVGEKNVLNQDQPWLKTIEFNIDGTYIRLIDNNEDVTIESDTYTKFPFAIEPIETNTGGELNSAQIVVGNVHRTLQYYAEQYDGIVGESVTIRIFHNEYRQYSKVALQWTFKILSTTYDDTRITFTLGHRNPLLQRFPKYRYIARHCKWKYKSIECGATSPLTTCGKTWADCEERNNTLRFGGYLGLKPGSLRLGY